MTAGGPPAWRTTRRYVLLLAGYVRRAFLGVLAWRGFMLTLAAERVVPPLIGLAVWTTALPGRPEVAVYFVALLVVRLLTASYEHVTFAGAVADGRLTDDLLRPGPVVLAPLGDNLAWRAWHVLLMLPLLLGVGLLTAVRPAGADVAAALPAAALAAALRFLFGYTVALATFWTPRVGALNAAAAQLIFLLGGEAAPVSLLPDALRPWAAVLPFRALLGFPAELAAGLLTGPEARAGYALQLVWLAVFGGLAGSVWRAGVRRYTAVGG